MRVLVLRGGALGDFIVTLPALRRLRAACPGCRIELVGNAAAAELGRAAGVIDRVYSQHEARWSQLYSSRPLSSELRTFLESFDALVNFWPDPDAQLQAHFADWERTRDFAVATAGGAPRPRLFLTAPAQPACAPAARHFTGSLGLDRGEDGDRFQFELGVPRGAAIALHPGSGSARKNWPVERWAALCRRLPGPKLIVGGEADLPALEFLAEHGEVLCQAPLLDLARRLAGCSRFLGHDSGVSHLAAAVGTPCVLLFGPTDAAIWAPPGEHVRVLTRPNLTDISVPEVLAAIEER